MRGGCQFVLVLMYFVHLFANVIYNGTLCRIFQKNKQCTHSYKHNPLNHHVWPIRSVSQCVYLQRFYSLPMFSYFPIILLFSGCFWASDFGVCSSQPITAVTCEVCTFSIVTRLHCCVHFSPRLRSALSLCVKDVERAAVLCVCLT